MNIIEKLINKSIINPPDYIKNNIIYLSITGSEAYGIATDFSDKDIQGIVIPPKRYIFPQTEGYIHGFDKLPSYCLEQNQQWSKHHVEFGKNEYDFTIFHIHKFFRLACDGNPGMIDLLFTPRECIIYSNKIGEKIRENRHLFLSKAAWPKYKGYAYGQLEKLKKFNPKGKRAKIIEEHGYDTKHASQMVRLLSEIEQILTTGDLDLRENREQLKSIRNGKWSYDKICTYFEDKEKELEQIKNNSSLRDNVDRDVIKKLMIECLEDHYQSLNSVINKQNTAVVALREIQKILENSSNLLDFS